MSYILFLGREPHNDQRHNLGSTVCLSVLDRIPSGNVKVEVATDMHPRDRPLWLKGTPTLFRVDTQERWTGFQAFNVLMDLAFVPTTATAKNASAKASVAKFTPAVAIAPQSEEAENSLDGMWTSNDGMGELDETNESMGKKLSQEDFARAMQSVNRPSQQQPPSSEAPPMLEPLKD